MTTFQVMNILKVPKNRLDYLDLKEKARHYQIPISTVERDYVKNWVFNDIINFLKDFLKF